MMTKGLGYLGVNFIHILRAFFEIFGAKISYEKRARKAFMKLTVGITNMRICGFIFMHF